MPTTAAQAKKGAAIQHARTQHLPLFVASGLLLNLMPGPDSLYIVGRSVCQGRTAGIVSVLGVCSGCAIHTVAAYLL